MVKQDLVFFSRIAFLPALKQPGILLTILSEFYMRKLDYDKIAEAALIGDDLESQTAFAHQEIENQIRVIVETFDKE